MAGHPPAVYKVSHPRFLRSVFVSAKSDNDVVNFGLHYSGDTFFFTGTIEECANHDPEIWVAHGGSVITCLEPIHDMLFTPRA